MDHAGHVPEEIHHHPIGCFVGIRKLSVVNAHIDKLDTGFCNFFNLQHVDLSNNLLTEFPIFETPWLRVLNLSGNRIKVVSR